MDTLKTQLIKNMYAAFNARAIDEILPLMDVAVSWPNGWEGGYVHGHEGVRAYWSRQWQELDPKVTPVGFRDLPDGRLEVIVQQLVKDVGGKLLFDGQVLHIYSFRGPLITTMEIVAH